MIEIREVESLRDLKRFVKFPFDLFAGDPRWVSPLILDELNTLRRDKNPAFAYCEAKYWLAYKDGRLAGRVAGIINHSYIEKWQRPLVRFGWFDFMDDFEVCEALLAAVETWAKQNGLSGVHGPLGFCDLDKEGMLVDGFDERGTIITLYNYPYYPQYLERCGYRKDVDWVEIEFQVPPVVPPQVAKIAALATEAGQLRVVNARKAKDLLPYGKGIFELLNETYRDLYGVVTLTEAQIDSYVKQYIGFVNPRYVRVLVDDQDKVAAFGIAMPSLTTAFQKAKGRLLPFGWLHILRALKQNDRLDLYLVAVRPGLRMQGVIAWILRDIHEAAAAAGIKMAETTPMLESNLKVTSLWKHYGMRVHRRRRCFYKEITL